MLTAYDGLRDEIKKLEKEEKYQEALKLNEDYITLVHEFIGDIDDDRWWGWYVKSLIRFKLFGNKDFKNVIKYAEKSLSYNISDFYKSLSHSTMARCYEENGNIQLAINCHKFCEEFYRKSNNTNMLARTLNNIARLTNDENLMYEALNIKKEAYKNNLIDIKSLDQGYHSLCEIFLAKISDTYYLNLKNEYVQKVWELLHNISTPELKNDICNRMLIVEEIHTA